MEKIDIEKFDSMPLGVNTVWIATPQEKLLAEKINEMIDYLEKNMLKITEGDGTNQAKIVIE